MQISDLVRQYNSAVSNGEPMTGKMGVEKLVSALSELSQGNIFEGTINSVKGNVVSLGLSNGQQITARLDGKVSLTEGQSMFFQVKSNDGNYVQIRPFMLDGAGANLTLLDALKSANLPTDTANLSMVNQMMQQQMPIDKASLNQMYHLLQANPQVNASTIVQMVKLGIEITPGNAAQFENYMSDRQAITAAMDDFINELPEIMSDGDLSMYRLASQGRQIINIVTDGLKENIDTAPGNVLGEASNEISGMAVNEATNGNIEVASNEISGVAVNEPADETAEAASNGTVNENTGVVLNEAAGGDANEPINGMRDIVQTEETAENVLVPQKPTENIAENSLGSVMTDEQLKELNEQLKSLLPDKAGNEISLYAKDDSIVGTLNDIKELLKNTAADKQTLLKLFSGSGFKAMIKNALTRQWMITPEQLKESDKQLTDKIGRLYEKVSEQLDKMQEIIKSSGVVKENVSALAENIRGNIEFMNQVNNVYTYVQIPMKMNGHNASGQLYVYTNKKNITDPDKELSAFLHLDMDNLGATDVSIKMLKKEVSTNFYMDNDESYILIERFLPKLEEKLRNKGYSCKLSVVNEKHHVNFVDDFLKKDLPPAGQLHRYSFDMRA
ncbi:MAG: flagellar hook-length control protein FliK [Agathobacter sp.]|uniref:flagellar hook-length control protein FliK n=1 Tax=Agathobacter sp. TaxID=2021311 RepID=UPI003991033A